MGKSPGKWIKSVLFRKKASNSSVPKRRDIPKSSYEKASSAPPQAPASNVVVQPCFISEPVLVTDAAKYVNKEEGSGGTEITAVPNDEPTLSSPKEDGGSRASLNYDVPDESEKYKLEQAATKVQAVFRSYRARRAFRTLKGIIRLQAVIRGHLVRSQEKSMVLPVVEDHINYLGDNLISDSVGEHLNHKISKRSASLPANHDDRETLQHETKVPSYMAATKSAKAKLRGQASPRFGQEEVEKNGPARRYSLPSSVNAKPTSSPRVQRLVQSNGKGRIRIDRSLSSSRDSNEKVVQPEWKR